MLRLDSFANFQYAADHVLKYLYETIGFSLWMVTRTEGDDWIVLQAEDHGYGVQAGQVFRWADSFCSQMVEGRGPCIAHRSDDVPAYAAAPIGRQVPIGAYIGVPISNDDGTLFGTLCAIDPKPQCASIQEQLPLVQTLCRLLCSLLQSELKADEQRRRAERAQALALTDPLTGLYNRRGWDELIAAEEQRCRRHGHPACILSIDLDELKSVNDTRGHAVGDELICRAAKTIRNGVGSPDVVARVGGDEFTVLAVECGSVGGETLRQRLDQALQDSDVQASIGMAARNPAEGMRRAIADADAAMYAQKHRRRALLCS